MQETESTVFFNSYNCDEDCEECLLPLRFESTKPRTYNECKAECKKSSEIPIYFQNLFKGFAVQISVAIVTARGLQVQVQSKEFRHVGDWMTTLSDKVHLDPPKGLQAYVRKAGDRFEGHLTWHLAPRSKTCDYRIQWRANHADHWESEAFEVSHSKHYTDTRINYILEGLLPMKNYTIEVISVTSDEKQNRSTVCIVTPSLELGPPENLTLVNVTHLSRNTSTAIFTWWPPHTIPITDHIQEYRLAWKKIPVLGRVFAQLHFDSVRLPAHIGSFPALNYYEAKLPNYCPFPGVTGFFLLLQIAAVSSVTGMGMEAMILFNTTEPTIKVSRYKDQYSPVSKSKALPWRFITGYLVAIVCASLVGLTYAFVRKKYGSLSLAVEQIRERCHSERDVEVNLI
ncbi:hypothetical protein AWC38_SpisGene14406 [Stylophora pistillata]|uniref:Fibronectin type-III domain-containing protein n=1 Tax=Stylophora pistillata TaxID=50429 RepID=A0A2B4RRQ8_STYPI|nr:hypothetical protein AWC38_SpisGene14406 [Stylophora pistillata]